MNPSTASVPGPLPGPGVPRSVPARKIPKELWEFHREFIEATYPTRGMTAGNIIAMLQDRGLKVTERQLKRKIQDWKLDKKVKGEEMKQIIRKQQRRQAEEGKTTFFWVRGQKVPQEKIDRWSKSHEGSGSSGDIDDEMSSNFISSPAPTVTTLLSGISYQTASERDQLSPQAHYVESSSPSPRVGTPKPAVTIFESARVQGSPSEETELWNMPEAQFRGFTWELPLANTSPSLHTGGYFSNSSYSGQKLSSTTELSMMEPVHDRNLINPQSLTTSFLQREEEACLRKLRFLQVSLGAEHNDTLECLIDLGDILQGQGKDSTVEELLTPQALVRGGMQADGPKSLSLRIHITLAISLLNQGKTNQALKISKAIFEPLTQLPVQLLIELRATIVYGKLLCECGEIYAGESLLQKALKIGGQSLPSNHILLLDAFQALALSLSNRGELEQAERVLRVIAFSFDVHPESESTQHLVPLHTLGRVLFDQGKLGEAENILQQVHSRRQRILGIGHRSTLLSQITLATVRGNRLGNSEMLQDAYLQTERYFSRYHAYSHYARDLLARLMYGQGRVNEARILLEAALLDFRLAESMLPKTKFNAEYQLGTIFLEQGHLEKAIPLLETALTKGIKMLGLAHVGVKQIQEMLRDCRRKQEAQII